jgi:hypothetical protein
MNLDGIQQRCQARFFHSDNFAGASNSERSPAE